MTTTIINDDGGVDGTCAVMTMITLTATVWLMTMAQFGIDDSDDDNYAMTTAMVIIYYAGENENDDTNETGGDDANDIDDDLF